MRLRITVTLALAAVAFLAGCKAKPAAGGGEKPAAAPATQPPPAAPSPFQMKLALDPAQPEDGKPVTIRVRLADLRGKAVEGATVRAALVMVLMDMGKNEVTLAGKGSGLYEGTAKFTMAGPWNVVVSATAGGKTGEQRFDVAVR